MQDQRMVKELINQMNVLEKNNSNNIEYITSIDLMLTSDNNSTVKDAELSKKFIKLKQTMEKASNLSKEFTTLLKENHQKCIQERMPSSPN